MIFASDDLAGHEKTQNIFIDLNDWLVRSFNRHPLTAVGQKKIYPG
jgi:hypothetical protein